MRVKAKAEMDRASELSFATWKGRTEGVEKRNMEIALNALAKGYTLEQIHEITGLDMETIASLSTGT